MTIRKLVIVIIVTIIMIAGVAKSLEVWTQHPHEYTDEMPVARC